LSSSGSVSSAFWEMLNWGAVDRILWMGVLCLVGSLTDLIYDARSHEQHFFKLLCPSAGSHSRHKTLSQYKPFSSAQIFVFINRKDENGRVKTYMWSIKQSWQFVRHRSILNAVLRKPLAWRCRQTPSHDGPKFDHHLVLKRDAQNDDRWSLLASRANPHGVPTSRDTRTPPESYDNVTSHPRNIKPPTRCEEWHG
jgi:hypothetical protein